MSTLHDGACPGSDRLAGMDFEAHNEEVRRTWESFRAGRPQRVPVMLGTNARFFMRLPAANPLGIGFRQYSEDADLMFDMRLRFARWSCFNLLQDAPLGTPGCWDIAVDFQNYYEAAWFGCPIVYFDDQVPDTTPAFAANPERVMEHGLPDPFGGFMARARDFHDHFVERAKNELYHDRPIRIVPSIGTDGVMTVACNLFGPDFVCAAMIEDPGRLRRLFEFITEATIVRIRRWREHCGLPLRPPEFGFADDSIALISTAMYRRHVLPHHRRLCNALAGTEGGRAIHLCGDASRHFVTLRDELNVQTFDTGFPIDFARLRRELGPAVTIQGGPHIELLRTAAPGAVRQEVRRILGSGVLEGGRFVLREANNLAPDTPLENIEAMYHAGREFGRLDASEPADRPALAGST